MSIAWSEKPDDRAYLQIVSAKHGRPLFVRSAGPAVGVLTHWDNAERKTIPCMGRQCPLCSFQRPRWKGYMPAYLANGRSVIVEVTEGAARCVPQLLKAEIAGQWVKFTRATSKPNGAVFAEVQHHMSTDQPCLPFDPRPALIRAWETPTEGGDVSPL